MLVRCNHTYSDLLKREDKKHQRYIDLNEQICKDIDIYDIIYVFIYEPKNVTVYSQRCIEYVSYAFEMLLSLCGAKSF